MYLAIKKTNKTMQQYKLIILLSAIVDFLFSTTTFISMPLADMVDGKLFLINSGYFAHAQQPLSIIVFSCWLYTLYLLLVNAAMIFFYRYNVLCKQKSLSLWRFGKTYAAISAYVVIQCVLCYFTAEDSSGNRFQQIIAQNLLFAEDTPTVNVYDATKLVPVLHLLHGNFICSCLYGTIIFTGYKVHKTLAFSRRFMSRNTINVQNQLTKIMVLQAVYPLISLVTPILLYCTGPLFHVTLPFVGLFLSVTVSLIPIVNSLTTCVIIPSFRRSILTAILGQNYGSKVSQSGSLTVQGLAYNLRPDRPPIDPFSIARQGTQTNENEML
ncbi:hypothetical protein M3Y97_00027200 [Aphelenchoides bicaudatus]|nr:hypothetical protein M3Y97_00027200 [Aphelenchoides bicaudatus]